MSKLSYRSSNPDRWTMPKGTGDTSVRRHTHGRIQPLNPPSFFQRLFGAR